jgi:hypothetical protein
MPTLLGTWENDIRKTTVQANPTPFPPKTKVHKTPSQPRCGSVHLCHLTMWEVEIGRIAVPGLEEKNLWGPISRKRKMGMVACMHYPSCGGRSKTEESQSRLTWVKGETLLQNNQSKRAWGMAQAVEPLPCKHKTRSSNFSTVKKINKWRPKKLSANKRKEEKKKIEEEKNARRYFIL